MVKEEISKAVQETMSEQFKDPQTKQMADEYLQWVKDSAEVGWYLVPQIQSRVNNNCYQLSPQYSPNDPTRQNEMWLIGEY